MSVLDGVKNFRFSRILFTKNDGSPVVFYSTVITPDLRVIIKRGGGILSEKRTKNSIDLCDRTERELIQNEGFLPLSFIRHCVLRATFMDPVVYRRNLLDLSPSPATNTTTDSWDASIDDVTRSPPRKRVARNSVNRKKDNNNSGLLEMWMRQKPKTSKKQPQPSTSKDCEDVYDIEEIDSSMDGECVSKEVTRKRVQAVMKYYNLGINEAIQYMIDNQRKLWTIQD